MDKGISYSARKEEAIEEFRYILDTYILPLIQHNGDLAPVISPSPITYNKHVSLKDVGSDHELLFYPALSTPQFYFKIHTKSTNQDLGAAEQILREILRVSRFDFRKPNFSAKQMYDKNNVYRNALFDAAFEVGLCNWIGSELIYELIVQLREWSQKTYEGNHMPFGFIVDVNKGSTGTIDYLSFLKSNHSAVFTDGISSGIKLDYKGRIVKYFSSVQERQSSNNEHVPWTPYEYIDFANICHSENGSNWIGVIMQSNGDMMIFKSMGLSFVKRNGKWMRLDSYTIHNTIRNRFRPRLPEESESTYEMLSKKFADEVFLSVLDTSFAHSGGCIAIIDDENVDFVQRNSFPNDSLVNNSMPSKKKDIIKRLIDTGSIDQGKTVFQSLDRKLRLELLSLDGATVLDSTGRILCAGAIVKIEGGSEGGGRLAAAKELAKSGLAMKISMDGSIQCFEGKRQGNSIEAVETFKTL